MGGDVVISYYPLMRSYLDELAAAIGRPVSNLVVSAVRGGNLGEVIASLRAEAADTLYLPCPGPDFEPFMPLLRLISLLPRHRRVMRVGADFTLRREGRLAAFLAGTGLALRVLFGLAQLPLEKRRATALLTAPRRTAVFDPQAAEIIYLKSNLWVGVQAGGSVSHTAGVVRALTAGGRRVTYVSPSEAPELDDIDGVSVHRVPLPFGFVYPREINIYRYDRMLRGWTGKLRRRSIGFVYHRLCLGSTAAVDLSRRLGVPLVLEYNGSEVWISRHWGAALKWPRLAQRAEDACLRHAHLIVTISEALRRELIERGIEPERIVTHPNGFDPERFDPTAHGPEETAALRARLGIAADAVLATFVGTFGPWHGADFLARALIRLHATEQDWFHRSKLHLLFVGDGVNRPLVEARLAGAPIEGHYTFAGLVRPADTPLYLAASDILAAPHLPNADGSEFFGSPTKLFEYMGMGRPTVASRLGQIAEVLEGAPSVDALPTTDGEAAPGQTGILVAPDDEAALAAGLKYLVDHPIWRRSAGANARQRALGRYTWDHHVGAIIDGLTRTVPAATPRQPGRTRLLINAVHAKSGGGVTYLRNILPLLAGRPDLEIHLVIQEDQAEMFREIAGTLPLHVLPSWNKVATVLIQEQFPVPRLARAIGAEVIFSPANYGPVTGGVPSVILLRNSFDVGRIEQRLDKRLYWTAVRVISRLSFLGCRRAITVSRHACGGFLDAFGITADPRFEVVHHGVSPRFSPPADDQGRIPRRLLAVSDIYLQKNLETAILAVSLLKRANPEVSLEIAGRPLDPDYFDRLRRMVEELGIGDRVAFLGGRSPAEVADLYRAADVFVFPSLVETFGNPVLEAMASGLPVVCSDAAAMPEVAGDAALYARPGDAADMAEKITRLLDDPALWASHARRGVARAAGFTWMRTATATARVLRDAAGG